MSEWIDGEVNPWKTAELYPKRYYLYFVSDYNIEHKILYKLTNSVDSMEYEVYDKRTKYLVEMVEKGVNIYDWGLHVRDSVKQDGWLIYLMEFRG